MHASFSVALLAPHSTHVSRSVPLICLHICHVYELQLRCTDGAVHWGSENCWRVSSSTMSYKCAASLVCMEDRVLKFSVWMCAHPPPSSTWVLGDNRATPVWTERSLLSVKLNVSLGLGTASHSILPHKVGMRRKYKCLCSGIEYINI